MQSMQIFSEGVWSVHTHVCSEVAYYCAKDVAKALGYTNPREAVRYHVFEEDRTSLQNLMVNVGLPMSSYQERTSVYITEPGVYALIFGSKMETAKAFKRWVCRDVMPRLRKHYQDQMNAPLCLRTECDLHYKVVHAIRRFWPHSLLVAGLGELQDTAEKRLYSWRAGYTGGQPDLIIMNHHRKFNGLAIELKNPKGTGTLSGKQLGLLESYSTAGYKVLVSDEYDMILHELVLYFQEVRLICEVCGNRFKSDATLSRHHTLFHRSSGFSETL
jgi:prophage antirepressor-like protein